MLKLPENLRVLLPAGALLFLFLFPAPASGGGTERLVLPAGTALFEGPELSDDPVGSFAGEVEVLEPGRICHTPTHPLTFRYEFFRVRLPDGRSFYASPEISGSRANDLRQNLPFPFLRYFAGIVCAVAGAFAAWKHLRGRKNGTVTPGSAVDAAFFVLEALCLRYALSFVTLAQFPNAIPAAADDNGYFEVGYDLLHRSFNRPWRFTLGNGLLYIPFIALAGAREFYDIALAVDYFNLLITAPLAMVLAFLIFRRLGLSAAAAGGALFLGAVWPFTACHLEWWNSGVFPGFFMWPVPNASDALGAWRYYRFCIGAGFNAMSDTPGLCVLLLSLYLALILPLNRRALFFGAAVYGFACLIRINYCFFAPLALFLYWRRAVAERLPVRRIPLQVICAAAGFLLVFGWQLLVNFRDFGAPLRFGYVLHYLDFPPGERPADGFTLHTLMQWRNLRFLFGANHGAWTLFFTGVWFLRDRILRGVFVLWAVPVTVFFLGYYQTYCDAARFILPAFPAFFGAFCALEFWRELPRRSAVMVAGVIIAVVFFGRLNPAWGVSPGLTGVPVLAAAGVVAWRLFRSGFRRPAAATAFAGVYFCAASPFAGGGMLPLLLLRSAADAYRWIRRRNVEKQLSPE